MTPSKTLFYLCISFIAGIFLESLIYNVASGFVKNRASYVLLGFLVAGFAIVISSIFLCKKSITILGFCVLFLALGMMRFQISEFTIEDSLVKKFNDNPSKITLVGTVVGAPDLRDTFQYIKVSVEKLTVQGKQFRAKGDVLIGVSLYRQYQYLDQITFTGKLKTPKVFDDFNYKNYLLKDGVYSVMNYPKVESVNHNHRYNIFTFAYEKILFFKEKMRDSIYANFLAPQRLILEGVILGNNKTMTPDLRNKLNITGLRYLTAISGVHVIILSAIVMSLLLFLGFWRGQAFYFSIVFIWLYIVATGFSASGVRAAIMGSTFLFAQKIGRQNTSSRTIVLAATLMLMQNPLLLLYDVGFQLSFMASLGIIYVKPLLENVFQIFSKSNVKNLVDMLSVTLTAQIFVVPIMVYNFGTISLVTTITSILVLPMVSWLMIFGFLSSISGIFSNILGWIFSIPCWLLLTYFVKILDIFSQPWASVTIKNISWLWLVAYYAVLFAVTAYLKKYQKPKFLGF